MGLMTGARQRDTGAPNGPDRDCDITTNLCNTQTSDPPTFPFSKHKNWQLKKIQRNGLKKTQNQREIKYIISKNVPAMWWCRAQILQQAGVLARPLLNFIPQNGFLQHMETIC